MLTIAYYFLQVVLCSGMLMGYYWLVLRNKRFHQYNRFYLLAAALLSWIVPLIKISWNRPVLASGEPRMMHILYAVADNNSQIEARIYNKTSLWSWDMLASGIYLGVATFLFISLVIAFVKLYRLMQQHSCRNVGDVFLILTHAKGTPFSFFRYIFWNEEIDIRSEAGQQILKHELTHVQQKHSFDKLFIQLMLIGGWFNPFFWLLRREMEMIHEFIADKKAVNNGDAAALAQMLLTAAYPQQKFTLTHPFFFSPIKRRLLMLTNNRNPRFSYIRRLVVLPLLAIVVVLFAFRGKEQRGGGEISIASVVENYRDDLEEVFITKKETPADSIVVNGVRLPAEIVSIEELQYAPYRLGLDEEKKIATEENKVSAPAVGNSGVPEPLFFINGNRISRAQLGQLDPAMIEAVNVVKNADAVAVYGPEAVDGVVSIVLKPEFTAENIGNTVGETKHAFPNLSAIVKDAAGNVSKNRKVFVKETLYLGEEKTKVFEEVHETTIDNDGVFNVRIGAGSPTPSSKEFSQLDPSKGPYFINLKLAVLPAVPNESWKAAENYVDMGTMLVKDPIMDGSVRSSGFLTANDATRTKENVFSARNLPAVSLRLREPKTEDITKPDNSLKEVTVVGFSNKNPKEVTVLGFNNKAPREVTVIGYATKRVPDALDSAKVPAQFPGGKEGWEKYLVRNLNRDILRTNKAPFGKYTVNVSFLVNKDGSVSDVKAANDPGFGTKTEAERIILNGPKWLPAADEKGESVAHRQRLPISFVYQEELNVKLLPPGALEKVQVTRLRGTQLSGENK